MENIKKKAQTSAQFAQVANFIGGISDDKGNITNGDYHYLCRCPWTDEGLALKVANIHTNDFCALFPSMKATSCERHLRAYKELLAANFAA
jgi:hypothetical protein